MSVYARQRSADSSLGVIRPRGQRQPRYPLSGMVPRSHAPRGNAYQGAKRPAHPYRLGVAPVWMCSRCLFLVPTLRGGMHTQGAKRPTHPSRLSVAPRPRCAHAAFSSFPRSAWECIPGAKRPTHPYWLNAAPARMCARCLSAISHPSTGHVSCQQHHWQSEYHP